MKTNSLITSITLSALLLVATLVSSSGSSLSADAPDMKQMPMSPTGADGSTAGYEKAMSRMSIPL